MQELKPELLTCVYLSSLNTKQRADRSCIQTDANNVWMHADGCRAERRVTLLTKS